MAPPRRTCGIACQPQEQQVEELRVEIVHVERRLRSVGTEAEIAAHDAGVVDDARKRHTLEHGDRLRHRMGIVEVERDIADVGVREFRTQSLGENVELRLVAARQDHRDADARQSAHDLGADAARGARDDHRATLGQ